MGGSFHTHPLPPFAVPFMASVRESLCHLAPDPGVQSARFKWKKNVARGKPIRTDITGGRSQESVGHHRRLTLQRFGGFWKASSRWTGWR